MCMLIAAAIRRPSVSSLAVISAYAGAGSVLTCVLAFAILMTLPTRRAMQYPFTPVIDQGAFAKVFSDLRGSYPQSRHGVVRRSLPMDEYGVNGEDGESIEPRFGQWEEYGLPWRCFRSPTGFGLPRPAWTRFVGMLPSEIIPRLQLVPIPFVSDMLICTSLILAIARIPRWIVSRYRRQEGRCIKCGYLLKDLPRCPECGATTHISTTA